MGKAYLEVTWELIEQILKDAFGGFNPQQDECLACYIYRIGLDHVASAMGLPEDCKILKVSTFFKFGKEDVLFMLESPDFRSVEEGCMIPRVEAFYNDVGFSYWGQGAAVVGDYVKHCDRTDYKTRQRWWLRRKEGQTWRDRPPLL